MPRQHMPEQDPHERARTTSSEVNLGLDPSSRQQEALRCLAVREAEVHRTAARSA